MKKKRKVKIMQDSRQEANVNKWEGLTARWVKFVSLFLFLETCFIHYQRHSDGTRVMQGLSSGRAHQCSWVGLPGTMTQKHPFDQIRRLTG